MQTTTPLTAHWPAHTLFPGCAPSCTARGATTAVSRSATRIQPARMHSAAAHSTSTGSYTVSRLRFLLGTARGAGTALSRSGGAGAGRGADRDIAKVFPHPRAEGLLDGGARARVAAARVDAALALLRAMQDHSIQQARLHMSNFQSATRSPRAWHDTQHRCLCSRRTHACALACAKPAPGRFCLPVCVVLAASAQWVCHATHAGSPCLLCTYQAALSEQASKRGHMHSKNTLCMPRLQRWAHLVHFREHGADRSSGHGVLCG